MKKLLLIFLLSSVITAFAAPKATPSAEDVYKSCISKVSAAKSMRVGFSLSASGHAAVGKLVTKGSKFAVTFPGLGTWYDGKSIWSYSAKNKETTVWTPSKTELAESNPMLYISMASEFNVSSAKSSGGVTTVILSPKRRSAGVKSVTLTINNSTSLPKKLVINTGRETSTITVNSVSLNPKVADSEFNYPKASYPSVPVTDLR